tara:strand:+ start:168 stop:434 length:267 start_codon:yes stop_codon:yes gene_type:complete
MEDKFKFKKSKVFQAKEWKKYFESKSVTYRKAGDRCVEIHTFPDGMHQMYFYINSSEPINRTPTTVDNKKILDAIVENFFCGLDKVIN